MTEADYEALADFYEAPPQLDTLFGYAFNVNRVSAQAAAVQAVLADYLPALECGMLSDVPTAVDQLNDGNAYYLAQKGDKQFFVTISKEFAQYSELTKKAEGKRFEIANSVYSKAGYTLI